MKKTIVSAKTLKLMLKPFALIMANNSGILPILDYLKVQVSGGKITFTGTDLAVSYRTCFHVESKEEFEFHIHYKGLMSVLTLLTDQPIVLGVEDGRVILNACSEKFSWGVIPEDDKLKYHFDNRGNKEKKLLEEINKADLALMLKHSLLFQSKDELRPAMMCTLLEFSNNLLEIAATDAHKLYFDKIALPINIHSPVTIMIDKTVIKLLLTGLGEDILLSVDDEFGYAMDGSGKEIAFKLHDDRYPDYKAVIPTEFTLDFKVDREELINACKFANLFSNKSTHQIVFDLSEDKLMVSAENVEENTDFHTELNAESKGEKGRFGFNATFVLMVLNLVKEDEIRIQGTAANRSFVFNEKFLIMPVMISGTNS